MAQNQGTVVGGTIRPNDSQDRFPVALNNELKGGYRSVATIAERDAIYTEHRQEFMRVKVNSQNIEYELIGGIDNSKWKEVFQAFTTQEILSGGNYNNLEVTADLLVFKNENAQAILNGVWGKKDFHILNLSNTHEVKINHNSPSVTGNGQPIKLPTASGNMGIKGTARILQTAGYGYFVADTWGSKYRPEFKGLTKKEVVTINENSEAGSMEFTDLILFRDAQSTPMTKTELNTFYPDVKRPIQIVCNQLNLIYMKIDNDGNNWKSIPMTNVM